jgi:hypothetical protein
MKRNQITLFGIPTLLTVLIVILVFSFATLSFLNTLNIKKTVERGNQIITDTYTLQKQMDIRIIELEKELKENKLDLNAKDIEYDRVSQIISISMEYENLKLNVKLRLSQDNKSEIEIIEYRMSSGNNQDYTLDGDPVYGG